MNSFLKSRFPRLIPVIAVGWACLQSLSAQVITGSITSVSGPTGTLTAPHYVIDSDAENATTGYDRDTIPASANTFFSRPTAGTTQSETYRITAELLDDTNTPVTLSSGQTWVAGPENVVSFSTFQFNRSFTWDINLDPATDLGAGRSHTVRITLQRKSFVFFNGIFIPVWNDVAGPTATAAFTVVHFADLPENTANRNARGYLRGAPTWTKTYAVGTGDVVQRRFSASVPYSLFRYDVGGTTQSIIFRFTATLTDNLGTNVPLENGGVLTTSLSRAAFTAGTPNIPVALNTNFSHTFAPVGQLDPRNRTYKLTVRYEHLETTPSTYRDNGISPESPLQRLLHFNGTLRFGDLDTAFNTISNAPTPSLLGTNFVSTVLNIPTGTIPGFPDHTVGAGADLSVDLLTNGTAIVTSGTRNVTGPGGSHPEASFGGIRVSYPGTRVTPTGAVAEFVAVFLPQGLSYTPDRATSAGRYLPAIFVPGNRQLTNQFRHTGNLSHILPANAWVFDEARPVLFKVVDFVMPEDGTLNFKGDSSEWVHQAAADQLEAQQAAGQHSSPTMAYRLGNDGYLRFTSIVAGEKLAFARAADGSGRTVQAELQATPGSFRTHFPADSEISWTGGGVVKIQDGAISPDSVLDNASKTEVAFDGSCQGDACGPPPGTATAATNLIPHDSEWRFTGDGGIQAGAKADAITLEWGIRGGNVATHTAGEFKEGAFLASGHQLYASANPLAAGGPLKPHAEVLAPAVITLAGYDKTTPTLPVYPETVRYREGTGIWPGATFFIDSPAQAGSARIADMLSEAPCGLQQTVSKYYVRPSGISGRHVAIPGTFPDTLDLYGYRFGFTRFQLTFLSNLNVKSWINGGLDVPYPSDFSQRFLGLTLSCSGALESAEIDPEDTGAKPLAYWNGSFTPLIMRFAPNEGAGCYADRFLTIGLVSGAANIPTALAGTIAFLPSGNLGTLGDAIVGVDGRLGLPSTVPMDGPGSETYRLVPVSKLYFNNPSLPGAPSAGFVSFAASCDVPFFQDLKVHVMTSAQAGVPSPIHIAGGWPEGGQTFFTNNQFDPAHRGFPAATTLLNYRNPTAVTPYVVRAKQSLFGLVSLDYPLKWQTTGRYFESWPSDPTDLFVVKVKHQVDYLSANNTELSFGAQYEGLPKINLVSTAIDLADGQLGAAQALTNAARQFVTDTLNQGVNEIGNLVDDTMENVLDQAIDAIEDEVITPLHTAVVQSYNAAAAANTTYGAWVDSTSGTLKQEFDRYLDGSIGLAANSVKGRLQQLANASSEAANLLTTVNDAVDAGILAIDAIAGRIQVVNGETVFNEVMPPVPTIPSTDINPVINGIISGILAKENGPGGPERQIVQKLVKELIGQLAPPDLAAILNPLLADVASEVNAELNELLSEFDPTLDRITEVLLEARGYLVIVKGKLDAGQDIITSFNQIITNATAEINSVVNGIRATAYSFIDTIARSATYLPTTALNAAGNLINEFDQEEFVAMIRAELRNRLLATEFVGQIQYTLRQHISELDIAMRSAIDSAFGEVSRMCKELIKEALGPIDDAINGLTGDVNKYVGAGSVDGYAHIQGDTLRRLRLDAKVELKVPDELRLQAFIEINCYDSSTTTGSSGCLAPGQQLLEVKIGAFDVPLDWISPDMRADLSVWFSMQTAPNVMPRGIGGAITMTGGELDFQSFKITGFGASVAIGLDECYLAATARIIISSYEASGGIFFGRTCSLTPLLIVDPDVASILGSPPFTGAYVYGEVWIPISEVVLGIPASCLFRISAGVGAGAFFFVEGPTFGGKMLLGVSGEALCIVSIRGEVSLIGVMSGGSLRFTGRGTLTGKAGYCPFCLKFRESARVTYQDGSWSVDF